MSEQDLQTTLSLLNPWWEKKTIDLGIERKAYQEEIIASLRDQRITMITGSRRVGKTYLIFQVIHHLIQGGTRPEDILFLSLDNVNLKGLNLINYIGQRSFRYVFLDEIQALSEWEAILKSLVDLPQRALKMICSGSMSFLLSDRKGLLTGRNTSITVYPLSLDEFQQFSQTKGFRGGLVPFLEYGGYPEYVLERHPNYHAELLNDILQKDIKAHFGIRLVEPLEELLRLLAKQIGYKTSLNKLANVLKITDDTVKSYLDYLSQVYLVSFIYKYSPSVNDRIYSDRKYFFWDTGMRNQYTGFEDLGSLAENAVYIQLRKRYPRAEIFYVSDPQQHEVDFVVKEKSKAKLIEVKFLKFKEKILHRISPFFFKDPPGLKVRERLIITDGVEDKIRIKNTLIRMVSLETFLAK